VTFGSRPRPGLPRVAVRLPDPVDGLEESADPVVLRPLLPWPEEVDEAKVALAGVGGLDVLRAPRRVPCK
jgi:hypothetical protein